MPANLPCIPKYSDRRNGDGDVEELVRLGVLPICDDVAGLFRVPRAVNLTLVSALMMWLKLRLDIWISRKRCYSLCISREISYSHYHIITYTSLLLLYPVMLRSRGYRRKIAPGLRKATHVTLCLEFKLEMLDMIFGFPIACYGLRIVKCVSLDIGLQDFHVLYE
ncbi:hypothetical protein BJ912DRAFT_1047679 [Pholiota molesta]|nr:hypothetical protein BJ912DRAFT_1047679 [Pholiota molesta]